MSADPRASLALIAAVAALAGGCDRRPGAPATARADAGTPTPAPPGAGAVEIGEILRTGLKLYSQGNEELIIRDFFRDREGGFFVDVGAAHYRIMSTSYYLERHLRWSGIAIDAIAEYGPEYAELRPRTRFRNFVITDRGGGEVSFYRAEGLWWVSSTSREVAAEQARVLRGTGKVTELRVPAVTLDDLLAREGVARIDLLSMDIEEHEEAALNGFDIERFRPALVCIEADPKIRDAILRYFDRHGYERIDAYLPYDDVNWYFRPRPARP